jgi:aspartyl-tRNA(Asn)/glutamyl-tRNA(Gln) amidotransferase subunit A
VADENICSLALAELAEAIRAKRISAVEATEASLARLKRLGGPDHLNCVAGLDEEGALRQAKAADTALAKGRAQGPLHGVPLAHKDMFFRKGRASGCGARFLTDVPAEATAAVLERLDQAGAIEIARLAMVEFALGLSGHNAVAGTPRNPWNTAHITGGSSSGAAAAVAGRLVFGAFGSDTGGSIRFPAACCGIVGFKPTYGRVSRFGALPLSFSLDSIGPIARTVADCALLFAAVAGYDPRDAGASRRPAPDVGTGIEGGIRGVRVGVPKSYFYDPVAPEMAELVRASLDVFRRAGASVVEVPIPDIAAANPLTLLVTATEGAAAHMPWLVSRAGDYGTQTLARLVAGLLIPASAYIEALAWRKTIVRKFCAEVFATCDMLHTPVMVAPVPTIAESDTGANPGFARAMVAMGHCTRPFNFLGLPAISVPCGFAANGLPAAFQLAARPFAESLLLRAARAYERETEWHRRAPSL